jgi:hypothetical protein
LRPLALVLLLGCADTAAPEACVRVAQNGAVAQSVQQGDSGNVVDVASEAEFIAALRAGINSVRRTNTLVLTKPIWVDTLLPASYAFFAMSGNPGYGAHVERAFGGPECMLRFGPRITRVNLSGTAFAVAPGLDAGPSVCADKLFASVWRDVMFENHPGRPFTVGGGSAVAFHNLGLTSNGQSALLTEMADVAFIGGWIEDHRYTAANWGTGLDAYATQDRSGAVEAPILWQFPHQEFSKVNLYGFTRAHVIPGYCAGCELNLHDIGCVV